MITIIVLFGLGYIIGNIFNADTPEPEITPCAWREVGQVMQDGSIIYNGKPGGEALTVFATSDGPKLMKCE